MYVNTSDTLSHYYLPQGAGNAIRSVRVSFVVCELNDCKSNQPISLKLGIVIRPTNRIN